MCKCYVLGLKWVHVSALPIRIKYEWDSQWTSVYLSYFKKIKHIYVYVYVSFI